MKALFIGDSWAVQLTHIKGFDAVNLCSMDTQSSKPLFDAVRADGIELDHMPSHIAQCELPETIEELLQYNAIILSDCGSSTLYLDPEMMFKGVRKRNRLNDLAEYVERGGGLIMIGGYMSFSGIDGRARYAMTPLAEVLPVNMLNYDDRMEHPEGIVPDIVLKDHPVLNGITGEWPHFLGYNKIKAKNSAQEIATIGRDTFMAGMDYGKGRSFAFATDCSPHWGPPEFLAWYGYKKLFPNMIRWVARAI